MIIINLYLKLSSFLFNLFKKPPTQFKKNVSLKIELLDQNFQ